MTKEIRFCLNADEAPALSGAYAIAIEFADKVAVTLSGRSPIVLPAGRYLYCGSANPEDRRIHSAAVTCTQRLAPSRRNSSGSLAKFAVMRRASSRVSRFGRRAARRSNVSGIGGEAEVRGLRLKRR